MMIIPFAGSLSGGSLPHSLRVKGQIDEELDAGGNPVNRKGWLAWQDAVDLDAEMDYRLDRDDGEFHDIRTTSVDKANRRAEFIDIS